LQPGDGGLTVQAAGNNLVASSPPFEAGSREVPAPPRQARMLSRGGATPSSPWRLPSPQSSSWPQFDDSVVSGRLSTPYEIQTPGFGEFSTATGRLCAPGCSAEVKGVHRPERSASARHRLRRARSRGSLPEGPAILASALGGEVASVRRAGAASPPSRAAGDAECGLPRRPASPPQTNGAAGERGTACRLSRGVGRHSGVFRRSGPACGLDPRRAATERTSGEGRGGSRLVE
jgi:hypothetical protein